tara:strand:+ start:395 stop:628 length:234 start_codon:yes stop_codon:yes gene_type:complete
MWKKIKSFFNLDYPLNFKKGPEYLSGKSKKPEIVLKDLQKKTKKELEKLGRKMGVELDRRLTKAKLISQIKKANRNK